MSMMLDQILQDADCSPIKWAELDDATRIDVIKLGRHEGLGLKELAEKVGATTGMLGGFMDRHGLRIGGSYEISLAGGRKVRANRKRGKQTDTGFEKRMAFHRDANAQFEADARDADALTVFKPAQNEQAKLLALYELEDRQCRWPIDTAAGIRFCGLNAPAGQSYCADHHVVSVRIEEGTR